MDATWALRLYPLTWRRRYEAEMLALLEEHEVSLGTMLDLLRGALDARLHPRLPGEAAQPATAPPEPPMVMVTEPPPEVADLEMRRRLRELIGATTGKTRPEERALRAAHHVDRMIQEAEARGEFANLRLRGKPIPAELLQPADALWPIGATLAGAGLLPPWLQLQQEIDAELAECQRLVARVERYPPLVNRALSQRELTTRLETAREKTRRFNLMVPTPVLQRPLPRGEDLVFRLQCALERTERGTVRC